MPPRLLLPVLTAALLTACATTGPRSLRSGRGSYNAAIQRTNSEQLLLNLVRLRYRDAPLFLEITSISSSLSVEVGASLGGAISPGQGGSVAPGGAVSYIERPTITYAPLQGTRFGTQFLTPIELSDILLLYYSGWAIDRIFKVFVQRLGPLPNAPRASGPTPDVAPVFEDFFAAAELLRSLWNDGLLDLRQTQAAFGGALVLKIEDTPATAARLERLCKLLGMPATRATLVLTDAPGSPESGVIQLVPRSLLAGMYYVSQGVEVPADDYAAGRVPTTRDPSGATFDWRRLTGALMRVRHSAREPAAAYASVFYRDRWFYIDDTDLDSKSTFSFLSQVLEMQSGEIKNTGPILTLPIASD